MGDWEEVPRGAAKEGTGDRMEEWAIGVGCGRGREDSEDSEDTVLKRERRAAADRGGGGSGGDAVLGIYVVEYDVRRPQT
jgi:hypothetical protein